MNAVGTNGWGRRKKVEGANDGANGARACGDGAKGAKQVEGANNGANGARTDGEGVNRWEGAHGW